MFHVSDAGCFSVSFLSSQHKVKTPTDGIQRRAFVLTTWQDEDEFWQADLVKSSYQIDQTQPLHEAFL